MIRLRLQNAALVGLVVVLVIAVVQIYRTFLARTPLNLEGNIEIEGKMTANPLAN